jgi:hypothetical protein
MPVIAGKRNTRHQRHNKRSNIANMGWYHYDQCADGTCDVSQPVACPDGTCPDLPSPKAEEDESKQHATDEPEEEMYRASTPIYHLCQKTHWETALSKEEPYFPPSFWPDGRFTRASCEIASLPKAANHYYQQIAGDWLCLEINPVTLRNMGIPIAAHRASESTPSDPVECLKVYGGIPTVVKNVVIEVYKMQRDEKGRFYGMTPDISVPKCVPMKPIKVEKPARTVSPEKETAKKQEKPKTEHKRRFWQSGKK